MLNMPSLVNGLGRTSFMPCEKYVRTSSGLELPVMEMIGVIASNCRIREVADTPAREKGMT
jgi:hypothetical protein